MDEKARMVRIGRIVIAVEQSIEIIVIGAENRRSSILGCAHLIQGSRNIFLLKEESCDRAVGKRVEGLKVCCWWCISQRHLMTVEKTTFLSHRTHAATFTKTVHFVLRFFLETVHVAETLYSYCHYRPRETCVVYVGRLVVEPHVGVVEIVELLVHTIATYVLVGFFLLLLRCGSLGRIKSHVISGC